MNAQPPVFPRLDRRRRRELLEEMWRLVPAFLQDWQPGRDEEDVGQALLSIAAALQAEVTSRLDRVPEKAFRNFLLWAGIRPEPARAARLPVVLRMAEAATATVLAPARLRLQAQTEPEPAVFETEEALRVVPGRLANLAAVDGRADALFLPPPGLLTPEGPAGTPVGRRSPASLAGEGAMRLQVTPVLGLEQEQVLRIGARQHRIIEVKQDLVTIEPGLMAAATTDTPIEVVTSFTPFRTPPAPEDACGTSVSENRQRHELYLGDAELLKIESAATITLHGGAELAGAAWSYWGKVAGKEEPGWQVLESVVEQGQLHLLKPSGALEDLVIEGRAARWIRAAQRGGSATEGGIELRGLRLAPASAPPEQAPDNAPADRLRFEALANTVPLVTNTTFFPLGREPRLFDAFYLSCIEAFSKPGSMVTLDFTLADATLGALVAAPGAQVAFAIARDRGLYRVEITAEGRAKSVPLEAPTVRPPGAVEDALSSPDDRRLPLRQQQLPAVTADGSLVVVLSEAGDAWLWAAARDGGRPRGWNPLGAPENAKPVALAITETSDGPVLFAATGSRIHRRTLGTGAQWQQMADAQAALVRLVVVRGTSEGLQPRLLAVGEDGSVYLLAEQKVRRVGTVEISPDLTPAAQHTDGGRILLIAGDRERLAIALLLTPDASDIQPQRIWSSGRAVVKDGGFVVLPTGAATHPVVLFRPAAEVRRLEAWVVGATEPLADDKPPPATGAFGPQPALLGERIVVPGNARDLFTRRWGGGPRAFQLAVSGLREGLELNATVLEPVLIEQTPGDGEIRRVVDVIPITPAATRIADSRAVYVLDRAFATKGGAQDRYRLLQPEAGQALTGEARAGGQLQLDDDDEEKKPAKRTILVMVEEGIRSYKIESVAKEPAIGTKPERRVATLSSPLTEPASGPVRYRYAKVPRQNLKATPRAVLDFDAFAAADRPAARELIARSGFVIAAEPSTQALLPGSDPASRFVALSQGWTQRPATEAPLMLVVPEPPVADSWTHQEDVAEANPELSWEYWTGAGWWRIERHEDETGHLLNSGTFRFQVPPDLAETDVGGLSGHWIRARLVGGEYGREAFIVRSKEGEDKTVTLQTAVRDTSQIHPPVLQALSIYYEVPESEARPPAQLLSLDSGAWRDQSEANRTRNAVVTAFEPAATMLRRFDPDGNTAEMRALHLGFEKPLQGGSIRLLAIVAERETETRLAAEVLRGGRFVPVSFEDGTRGLSQSGLLTFALDAPPTLTALFGGERHWLRLRPAEKEGQQGWQPELHGLFVNAVMAEAAETQEFEILGSSDGAPRQHVFVARPPLLPDSLELRVREPLGEEEIATLRRDDPGRVLTGIEGQPGAWVRWKEVGDPDDAAPRERAYALDHASGEVRFGDGLAGMIPPPGLDAIAAFSYRRGGGAAANAVQAWDALQLVTPVEGVEAVVAPLPAVGGADPAGAERTITFAPGRIRHRDRAVTAADLEALALAGSPEIAQARCTPQARPPRLVVVLRGADPRPGKEFRDALRRRLVERAAPGLGAAGGLRVDAPLLRRLRFRLGFVVEELALSGPLEEAARGALQRLLDPTEGGVGGGGWPLGAVPRDGEVMAVLAGLKGLLRVESIALEEVHEATAGPFPARIAAGELVMLAPDGIVIGFRQEIP